MHEPPGRTSLSSLAMRAKHSGNGAEKHSCGMELVAMLTEGGDYQGLIAAHKCPDYLLPVREKARDSILSAAFCRCKAVGSLEPLHEVASGPDVPNSVAWHAGMALFERYSAAADEEGLWKLLLEKGAHDEVRTAAGNRLLKNYESGPGFLGMFRLATGEDVIFEVKKPAGLRLIELAVEHGNYPLLLRLEAARLTMDVRIAMDGQVDAAAQKAIEDAARKGDFALLTEISEDKRLKEHVRERAERRLRGTFRDDSGGPEKASELKARLARLADGNTPPHGTPMRRAKH